MDRINENEVRTLPDGSVVPASIPQTKLDKLARHRQESFAESQKTAAEKIKHRLTTVPAKHDPRYPKVKYHPHQEHVVVKTPEEEARLTPAAKGWVDSPDEFPPSAVRLFPSEEKLAMFEEMARILGVQEGESPVEALVQFREKFNDMARKVAGAAPETEIPGQHKKKGK